MSDTFSLNVPPKMIMFEFLILIFLSFKPFINWFAICSDNLSLILLAAKLDRDYMKFFLIYMLNNMDQHLYNDLQPSLDKNQENSILT